MKKIITLLFIALVSTSITFAQNNSTKKAPPIVGVPCFSNKHIFMLLL